MDTNMKKIIAGAILIASSSAVLAAGPAGCGAGTAIVFQDAKETYEHVLAATTNGSSGNQTFGMTSGTLGCEAAGGGSMAGVQSFMNDNIDQLASDSAKGQGETLSALIELVGVSAEDNSEFSALMQANFDQLFTAQSTSGNAYDAMVTAMSTDAKLAKYLG
jgi:hypothetical protein